MIVRGIEEKDYEVFKRLFDQAFFEYSEFFKQGNPQHYMKELKERREVTHSLWFQFLS